MISELDKPIDEFSYLKNVFFFSPTATAATDKLINSSPGNGNKPQQSSESYDRKDWENPITRKFLSKQIIFFRTIADDRKLTDQLVTEIQKRLFDWSPWPKIKKDKASKKENNFKIALVSEWDTLYGRSLPEAFIASAYDKFKPTGKVKQTEQKKEWVQNHIYRFSYLRGIDGIVSSTNKAKEDKLFNAKADGTKSIRMERPEGTSQKDYLRRLATDMARIHQMLKNDGTKGIRAIGVLGSDVYDKLLILRALRKQFPKAIFFTTDLDVALLHPDQFQWTRNMLVASSFDLKIANYSDIQALKEASEKKEPNQEKYFQILLDATERTIPQNRDVYQTSVFLSVIWAINPILAKDLGSKIQDAITFNEISEAAIKAIQNTFDQVFGRYIKPRVYEIGRYGAVDLMAIDNKKKDIDQWSPFYPLPMSSISRRAMIMISSSAVALGLLLFLFWRRWIVVSGINTDKTFRNSMRHEDYKAMTTAFVAVVLLFVCYLFQSPEKTLAWCMLFDYLLIASVYMYLAHRIMKSKDGYVRESGGEA